MRFLASKKDAGAVTATTPSGPLALGSIPAAASRIKPSASKSRESIGDFTYHSMSCGTNGSSSSIDPSSFLGLNNSQSSKSKYNSNIKRLDLSVLHKYMQENRRNSTNSVTVSPSLASQVNGNKEAIDNTRIGAVSKTDIRSVTAELTTGQKAGVSSMLSPSGNFSTNETIAEEERLTSSQSALRRPTEVSSSSGCLSLNNTHPSLTSNIAIGDLSERDLFRTSSVLLAHSEQENNNSSLNITNRTVGSVSSENVAVRNVHPAGIILTRIHNILDLLIREILRRLAFGTVFWSSSFDLHNLFLLVTENFVYYREDYECEPSLEELAEMALKNNAICHIKNGFTIRRLAFGSVFWPGPFDLHNVNLDKLGTTIVHFRQHEVIVYPDDNLKPPVGQELNRFAEVSLDRVWPRDKKTKEYITDPLRLEEMGYRAKLERASLKMGAKFKDYRPETGTWVFTVPHFTKYGLADDDEDDVLDEVQLKMALKASRIQNAVQRAKLPKLKIVHEDEIANQVNGSANDGFQDYQQELKQIDSLSDSVFFARGLGGINGYEKSEQNVFFDALTVDDSVRSNMILETEHKMELYDNKTVLGL
ncbi:unnamed protein product [Onchocerca flexuosa]|uniref:Peptidase S59 domain-containing protein n=1 Tax=Onchocerca flexuosa TaxID=387005 RepID=A0A183H979_9BILA|nr:unnamed protein product [Onchocerca flexuosa]